MVDAYRAATGAPVDEVALVEELRPREPTTTRRGLDAVRAALAGEKVPA